MVLSGFNRLVRKGALLGLKWSERKAMLAQEWGAHEQPKRALEGMVILSAVANYQNFELT